MYDLDIDHLTKVVRVPHDVYPIKFDGNVKELHTDRIFGKKDNLNMHPDSKPYLLKFTVPPSITLYTGKSHYGDNDNKMTTYVLCVYDCNMTWI